MSISNEMNEGKEWSQLSFVGVKEIMRKAEARDLSRLPMVNDLAYLNESVKRRDCEIIHAVVNESTGKHSRNSSKVLASQAIAGNKKKTTYIELDCCDFESTVGY